MAREIMILQKLDHPNVLKLEGLATSRMHFSIYLVFNFMQSDLTRVISRPGERLTERQIKCYMHQLLSGLQHCHERGILHRDIKGSNILIDKDGVLKIGDFGLANYYNPNQKRPLTNKVVTLWYRAPELLLGSTDYGVGIDLWSAGCLLAEMFLGRPIMPGRTEVEQLHRIFKLCGSPTGDYWRKLKLSANFLPPQPYKSCILETFKDLPLSTKNFLTVLLTLEPYNRGTAASALQSEFFCTEPLACDRSGLPVFPNKEEDETKLHRERKKHISSGRKKQHFEEIQEQKRQDQALDVLSVYSASPNKIEKAELLEHHQKDGRSTEGTFSATKPEDDHSSPLITFSPSPLKQQQLSRHDEILISDTKLNSNCAEQPKNASHPHGFERSSSSSGVYRYSGLDNGNVNGQPVDFVRRYGLVKRSNSTSEFISFSAEWRPKYTIVD
ncbi:probable serine/threonine-protein kinase At1g54610 [Phalaenopsis equestris]|uniref:probable serine/threonine-protein kinase At1g54610 n=1 Tax=Phalaenopsis equestris TaxID=78828 RepID=UPI0009E54AF3|nr:probable serine/threonine-protein kinase At1g54610 [Phalaenopsis equestris]